MTGIVTAEDALEIGNAIHGYCHCVDDERFADLGALLADCVLYVDDRCVSLGDEGSVAALFAMRAAQARAAGRSKIRHLVGNTTFHPDGADIVAQSACLVIEAYGAVLKPALMAGYTDRFRRLGGRWRFVERRIVIDNQGSSA